MTRSPKLTVTPEDTERAVTEFLDNLTRRACAADPDFRESEKKWRKLIRGMATKFGDDGREVADAILTAFSDGAYWGARAVARRWIVTNKLSAFSYGLLGRDEPQEGSVGPLITKAGL